MGRYRVFNICQYEKHPDTGELLITEEKIKDALLHRTIKRYAYICHDEDVYSALDEEQDDRRVKGEKKPRHWHIVIEMGNNATEISAISRWFGVPENFIDIAKGRGAFLDCVKYLTHEDEKQQAAGKRLYNDERVVANFNFREELDNMALRRAKYGRDLDVKDMLRNEIMFQGKTLRWAAENYPIEYQNDFKYLQKCRLEYIRRFQPAPTHRINYYIDGHGGYGKSLLSKALARTLVDPDGSMCDDEIFFFLGADNVSFEGYDGQPCIIFDDKRAYDILKQLGSRSNVFSFFSLFPDRVRQNVKNDSVILNNTINIVNSVQPWDEFLDGLAGEYKDKHGNTVSSEMAEKSQAYRRFPFFICVHENDFDLGINKGVFNDTYEYEQYVIYKGIVGNFRRMAEKCGDNTALVKIVNGKALELPAQRYKELEERMHRVQDGTDDEIIAYFDSLGYGKIKDGEPIEVSGEIKAVEEMQTSIELPLDAGTDVPKNEAVSDEDLPF